MLLLSESPATMSLNDNKLTFVRVFSLVERCVAIVFVLALGTQARTASWNLYSPVEVSRGDDVTITCTVTDLRIIDVVRLFRLTPSDRSATTATTVISDNGSVKDRFASLGRYRVYYDFAEGRARASLTYRAIEGRDGGTIGCGRLGDAYNKMAYINVTVLVPITEVHLVSIHSNATTSLVSSHSTKRDRHENTIVLRHNLSAASPKNISVFSGLHCAVTSNGSCDVSSLRSIRVSVDNIDITDVFERIVKSERLFKPALIGNQLKSPENTEEELLGRCRSTVTLAGYRSSRSPVAFDGRILTCTAFHQTRDLSGKSLAASARLVVHYAPMASCGDSVVRRTAVGQSLTIVCDVHSNPTPQVSWDFYDGKRHRSLPDSAGKFIVREKAISHSRTQIFVTLNSVESSLFGIYSLTAINDVGSTVANFILQPSGADQVDPSMSGQRPVLQFVSRDSDPSSLDLHRASMDGQSSHVTSLSSLVLTWTVFIIIFTFARWR